MANNIFILAFIFAISWKLSDTISVNCTFEIRSSSVSGDSEDLTAVYGEHQPGKSHVDVEGIHAVNRNLRFLPTKMESFFPNLKDLDFGLNSISNITNSHLIPFPNLVKIGLFGNRVTSLDHNLLAGLQSLLAVDLDSNNIMNVAHDLILPRSGVFVNFLRNPCIDMLAYSPSEIEALRFSLLKNCPSTISQIEYTLQIRTNWITNMKGEVQSLGNRSDFMEQRQAEINDEVKSLATKVTDLENKNVQLINDITDLQQSNSQLTREVAELQQTSSELKYLVADLQQSNLQLTNEVADVRQDTSQLTDEVAELQLGNVELNNEIADLQQSSSQLNDEVADLKQSNLQLTSEVEDLSQSNSQLADEVSDLQLKNNDFTDKNSQLERRIGFLDTRAAFLEIRVAMLEAIIESKLGLKNNGINENDINDI